MTFLSTVGGAISWSTAAAAGFFATIAPYIGDALGAYKTREITDTVEDTTSKIMTLIIGVVAFNYLTKK